MLFFAQLAIHTVGGDSKNFEVISTVDVLLANLFCLQHSNPLHPYPNVFTSTFPFAKPSCSAKKARILRVRPQEGVACHVLLEALFILSLGLQLELVRKIFSAMVHQVVPNVGNVKR
jgi:hypothetical protein